MDDYDMNHNQNYDKILNVYNNDDVYGIVTNFFNEHVIDISEQRQITQTYIIDRINVTKVGLLILDYREITNIGIRVFHHTTEPIDNEISQQMIRCYLIQIWRSNRPLSDNVMNIDVENIIS